MRGMARPLGESLGELNRSLGERLGLLHRPMRNSLGEDDGTLTPCGCREQLVEVLLGDEEGRLQSRREGLGLETGGEGCREQDGPLAPRGGAGGDLEGQGGELLREDDGWRAAEGAGGGLGRCDRSLLLRSRKGN